MTYQIQDKNINECLHNLTEFDLGWSQKKTPYHKVYLLGFSRAFSYISWHATAIKTHCTNEGHGMWLKSLEYGYTLLCQTKINLFSREREIIKS